ncbi:hypothetical protein UNDKW_3762 [Undibacterium sp. KW1]|uniref:hypothetical protein n=1 Tax=Undibacterium sp. KW1 TaxID=2058624 RepID=UPI001331D0FD|nr:hypothetical protein [Undibacterium sp. KW1]BBB62035.1 hypothetical protein UNDKW_3762 [Undibacterium sp. KW1]
MVISTLIGSQTNAGFATRMESIVTHIIAGRLQQQDQVQQAAEMGVTGREL